MSKIVGLTDDPDKCVRGAVRVDGRAGSLLPSEPLRLETLLTCHRTQSDIERASRWKLGIGDLRPGARKRSEQ